MEIIVNAVLLVCIGLNVFIAIQVDETVLWVIGNLPIIILSVLALIKNQQMLIEETKAFEITKLNDLQKAAWNILQLNPLLKFPIIFVLCLPVIAVITGVLLLFGQKPDSLIRTFTETYHHGLSQWNYKCDNVECGGHYLCSVAAKGHKQIVKPQRFGVRNGGNIICNRQLLVSNAFEELLQERLPKLHRLIRKQYNKVGSLIHRHYYIFDNKIISDAVYIMMKPLEWVFLLTLYLFDRKPENRIAVQYLSINERKQLKAKLSS